MLKVFVSPDQCKPGMRIAENIFNEFGAVIIYENTTMNRNLIQKIKELGIEKFKVYINEEIFPVEHEEFVRAQYDEDREAVKEILHDISTGKNINMDKVTQVSESVIEKAEDKLDIINCISQMKSMDDYTHTHSINVSILCMLIAKWLKYDLSRVKLVVQAGLLHDVGKVMLPREILQKRGELTKEEYEEAKKHVMYGYNMAKEIPGISSDVLNGILMHHEREDGSGYPIGAKSEQIHDFAKIIAVADIYDAMTSERVYKKRTSPFEVFELFQNQSFQTLDTRIRITFLTNIANYYVGERVRLSNGDTGEIVYINSMHISRPIVKCGEKYVDLSVTKGITVEELL
jgi:putative nucleotidyltransferase with HDIG domain